MGDHISSLESYFLVLAFMGSEMEEPLKGVIFLSLLSKKFEYLAMISSVNTMQDEQATSELVRMLFLKEIERL